MTRDSLESLSREELITLLLTQTEQRDSLQALVAQLQAENEVLRLKLEKLQSAPPPPTTSRNSSQPPSRDQKGNKPANPARRKHGPPQGHPKYERQFVTNPDETVELRPAQCPTCQTDLSQTAAVLVDVTQITELPEPKAQVIEVRQYEVTCPCCGQVHTQPAPAGLELNRSFGARLEATVIYYRQEQHLSYERTQATLFNLHGVTLSEGGIDQIMQRGGQAALEEVKPIQVTIQHSAVVNSDETSARVAGQTWWHWVFCTATAMLHVIQPSRGQRVIEAVMGEHEVEVWGSDCLEIGRAHV